MDNQVRLAFQDKGRLDRLAKPGMDKLVKRVSQDRVKPDRLVKPVTDNQDSVNRLVLALSQVLEAKAKQV